MRNKKVQKRVKGQKREEEGDGDDGDLSPISLSTSSSNIKKRLHFLSSFLMRASVQADRAMMTSLARSYSHIT